MIEWLPSLEVASRRFEEMRHDAKLDEERSYETRQMQAWCECCRAQRLLRLPASDGSWISLRENLLCSCGMNSRMRMILGALAESPPRPRFLMLERVTPLFALVAARFPFVEGCEYFGPGASPGSVNLVNGLEVRHENLMELSYRDRSFQAIFHGDVLEHVPDLRRALSECHRVLDVGGNLLFTCPVMNRLPHLVRACIEDGQLVHILPPAYHGNPMDENGALVFTEPGLSLMDDLRAAGFESVEMGLAYDPGQGIFRDGNPYEDYNTWPIIFRATRLA